MLGRPAYCNLLWFKILKHFCAQMAGRPAGPLARTARLCDADFVARCLTTAFSEQIGAACGVFPLVCRETAPRVQPCCRCNLRRQSFTSVRTHYMTQRRPRSSGAGADGRTDALLQIPLKVTCEVRTNC